MAKPRLSKLNPMDFTKMTPARQAKIEAAPAKALPRKYFVLKRRNDISFQKKPYDFLSVCIA